MHLVICVSCGHPAIEHGASGCAEVLDLEDGAEWPAMCACLQDEAQVMRQVVPPLPGPEEGGDAS